MLGVNVSLCTNTAAPCQLARGQQPLSEAEMRAVMKASQTNQRRVLSAGHGDQFSDQYQQQQHLALMGSRKGKYEEEIGVGVGGGGGLRGREVSDEYQKR